MQTFRPPAIVFETHFQVSGLCRSDADSSDGSVASTRSRTQDMSREPEFQPLVDFMQTAPVVCMVWQGFSVITEGNKLVSKIRHDCCIVKERRLCYISASHDRAVQDIELWFSGGTVDWKQHSAAWVTEEGEGEGVGAGGGELAPPEQNDELNARLLRSAVQGVQMPQYMAGAWAVGSWYC
jgi:nucleoside diphosphate kinase